MTKVMFISSMGGHLNELMQLDFEKYDFSVVTEKTDATLSIKEKYKDKAYFLMILLFYYLLYVHLQCLIN